MTGTRGPAAPAHGYIKLPEGWERVSAGGPGPFVTREVLLLPDGTLVQWRSRAHRKSASHATRWLAALFAVGSICFLVASVAAQWASSPRPAIGVTFFAGSLLFTAASYLGFSEAVNVPREHHRGRRLRLLPARSASSSRPPLPTRRCCHRWWCVRRRSLSWWIVALNLVGSVAFGIAAIASLADPSTQALVNARIANAGTSLGAACFLAGALLLPREAAAERRSRESSVWGRDPTGRGPER